MEEHGCNRDCMNEQRDIRDKRAIRKNEKFGWGIFLFPPSKRKNKGDED
jgi:hypothetical protein